MDIVTIIDRLKKLKALESDTAVADLLGIKHSAFAERKRRSSIPFEEIVSFCDKEGLNIDWVLTGAGPPERAGGSKDIGQYVVYDLEGKEPPQYLAEKSAPFGTAFVIIPGMRSQISALGKPIIDETIEMKLAFRRDWILKKGDPEKMAMLRVYGDSMERTLFSGDVVIIDLGRNRVDPHGGLYAISMDHTMMVKRIQVIPTMGKLKVISDNNRYEPIIADPEQVQVHGKVIWYGREIER